ncbi:MAG: hypothetical protein R6U46_02285 [Marinilabilia sp.]
MSRTRLIDLLSEPDSLDESTLESLREALEAYPFFQAGRMLWIKNLHKLDHIRYNSELKLAAAFIPDRSRLFFLINDLFSPLSAPDEDHKNENEENTATASGDEKDIPSTEKSGTQDKNPQNRVEDGIAADSGQNDERSSGPDEITEEKTGQIIGEDANYFEVDDAVSSATGELIDFSVPHGNPPEVKDSTQQGNATDEDRNSNETVLPSADLLDYEKEAYSSVYSVEREVSPSPVDFNESHSFSEWLDLLRNKPVQKPAEDSTDTTEDEKQEPRKKDLIDSFLKNAGDQKRIVPSSGDDVPNEDFAARFTEENDDLMTETLADIHIQQERYHKAVEIFERLRLKYPEKSVYFARRVEEMEELINNQ